MWARTCGPTCKKCLLSEKRTPLIRYSNARAPLTRPPPCLFMLFVSSFYLCIFYFFSFCLFVLFIPQQCFGVFAQYSFRCVPGEPHCLGKEKVIINVYFTKANPLRCWGCHLRCFLILFLGCDIFQGW